MHAKGVWVGNDAWPTNRSLAGFANDVFRLEGAKTDREKALVFYQWITRCMNRGGTNLHTDDGSGAMTRCFDALTIWASWSCGECTDWGWIATEALCSAGLKARRVVAFRMGHTFYEVFYKGLDGVEQWHAFDPFIGWYFLNDRGEVASCEELAKNPMLALDPKPGHPLPLGHHPDRTGMAHRHACHDQLFIDQPIYNETLGWELKKGQSVTCSWIPETPEMALFANCPGRGETPKDRHPHGTHCDIPEVSRLGELTYPQHEPYWQNYRWPTPDTSHANDGRPVRWPGSGALRWKPLLQGEKAAAYAINAKFENGVLKTSGPKEFTEVWYHFKLPYLVSYIALDYDIIGAGSDYCGFAISGNDRRNIWPLKLKTNSPHYGRVVNGQAEWKAKEPSVQGMKEFWLRVDMVSYNPTAPTVALQALHITVGFQHNMNAQPRLLPGKNPLWLSADHLDAGDRLEAEWIYQLPSGQKKTKVELTQPGTARAEIKLDEKTPPQIKMTGLTLRCL